MITTNEEAEEKEVVLQNCNRFYDSIVYRSSYLVFVGRKR